MAKKSTALGRTRISKKNTNWLHEVEIASGESAIKDPGVLTDSIYKLNELLGVLATLGGGPPEPEFSDIIETIIQDFRLLLPLVRLIYEAHKDAWFDRGNVLKHGHCHARTWHDIVLKTAEEFTEGSRLINSRNACKILYDSQYESGEIELQLELEREHAERSKDSASKLLWTPEFEKEARRLIDAGNVTTATALQEQMAINRQVSQKLFRHITGKAQKKHHIE